MKARPIILRTDFSFFYVPSDNNCYLKTSARQTMLFENGGNNAWRKYSYMSKKLLVSNGWKMVSEQEFKKLFPNIPTA